MSLWGKQDALAVTGTSIDVTNADATVTGTGTAFNTQVKNGDTLIIDGVKYKVLNVVSATELELASVYEGSTATVVVGSVKIQQTPKFLNTTDKRNTYGIDGTEAKAGGDNVITVAIQNSGTGYLEVPGVNITGGGGSSAAATATIAGGSVTAITITNVGSSYETVPSVFVDIPRRTIATTAVNTTGNEITYTAHGLDNGDAVMYKDGGGTAIAGLTDEETYYVIKTAANTFKLAATEEDALADIAVVIDLTGTGNNDQFFDLLDETTATAVASKGLGSDDDGTTSGAEKVTNPGWVLKTVGTGGRAGRVQYETLVAGRSLITGDAADDLEAPDA